MGENIKITKNLNPSINKKDCYKKMKRKLKNFN